MIFDNAKIIYNGRIFKYYFKRNTFDKNGRFIEPKLKKSFSIKYYKDWENSIFKKLKNIFKIIKLNKYNNLKNLKNDTTILNKFY